MHKNPAMRRVDWGYAVLIALVPLLVGLLQPRVMVPLVVVGILADVAFIASVRRRDRREPKTVEASAAVVGMATMKTDALIVGPKVTGSWKADYAVADRLFRVLPGMRGVLVYLTYTGQGVEGRFYCEVTSPKDGKPARAVVNRAFREGESARFIYPREFENPPEHIDDGEYGVEWFMDKGRWASIAHNDPVRHLWR